MNEKVRILVNPVTWVIYKGWFWVSILLLTALTIVFLGLIVQNLPEIKMFFSQASDLWEIYINNSDQINETIQEILNG